MNTLSDVIPQPLIALHDKLGAVDGVSAEFRSDSEVVVEFKGHRIGNWVPDGTCLMGAFACEAALLSADSADEAYRLTIGRLG
jgi:hypothetical protein